MGRRFTVGGSVCVDTIGRDVGPATRLAPKVIHIDPRQAGVLAEWQPLLARSARLNFDHVCIGPLFALDESEDPFLIADIGRTTSGLANGASPAQAIAKIAGLCAQHGMRLFVDIVLDRFAVNGETARELAGLYSPQVGLNLLDPRIDRVAARAAAIRLDAAERLVPWWAGQLSALARAGASGFRLIGLPQLSGVVTRRIVEATRQQADCAFWAWTPGLDWSRHVDLAGAGFEAVFASTAWWDGRAPWYVREYEALRRLATVIGVVEEPLSRVRTDPVVWSDDLAASRQRRLKIAAATTHGLMMPDGFQFIGPAKADLSTDVAAANALVSRLAADGVVGELRAITGPGAPVSVLVRVDSQDARMASRGVAVAINVDATQAHPIPVGVYPLPPAAGAALSGSCVEGGDPLPEVLQPQEVAVVRVDRLVDVREASREDKWEASTAAARSPIVIDRIAPEVSGGIFAAKHIVGRPLAVEADIFADGHDILAAELLWRASDEKEWQRLPLRLVENDRWRATITPRRVGRHYFAIEAWRDEYASLCHALEVKYRAGIDVTVEIAEAKDHLQRLMANDCDSGALTSTLQDAEVSAAVELITAAETRRLVAAAGERPFLATYEPIPVDVERPQAEFAAWYELFPRSLTDDPARHGTFDDVIAALPRIAAMGFDVLYFPPIHPIGTTNRKGRNNSLTAGPNDPGSPYAIGGEAGGHDGLHAELGTAEDFRRLVNAAHDHGLEIALDFAIQCSLDHPWLKEHPEWFRHRPDGSIRYAENPPKKYEDIVNVDFYAEGAVPALWLALRDVVLHWVGQGVRVFRVDNPHTKPLPFWQWMIADVRGRHPDVIFLSEAFTRPKMMYRLAKVGFSQSYTYFTWRNTKQEIVDYLRELTTTDVVDFFRPHFFVNTPDINPYFLQSSGRAGFLIRAALASTLSGLWGVYSGFELCEAAPLPGREEYLDSEKYEIRPRNFAAPGNIVAEISTLNRLRKAYPALQSHRGVTFYNAFNDRVLVYGKTAPSHEDMILVAVSLDPHAPQEASFEVPLWEWKLSDDGAVDVEDLMGGERFAWQGKIQRVRLDPATLPFAIWRISPRGAA